MSLLQMRLRCAKCDVDSQLANAHRGNYAPTNTAEIYDPATGVWTMVGNMLNGRARPSIALLADGRVLLAGG